MNIHITNIMYGLLISIQRILCYVLKIKMLIFCVLQGMVHLGVWSYFAWNILNVYDQTQVREKQGTFIHIYINKVEVK